MLNLKKLRLPTVCLVAAALALASCSSAPAAKPAEAPASAPEAPAATPAPTTVAPTTPAEPVTAAEFQAADQAIAEAEAAGAAQDAPGLLAEATAARDAAKAEADPSAARADLKTAIAKAHAARDAALEARLRAQVAALEAQARQALADAEAAGAPQDAADLWAQAQAALARGVDQTAAAPQEALKSFQQALDQAKAARLAALDAGARRAIADAEAVEADQFAPEPLNRARASLTQATDLAPSNPDGAVAPYQDALTQARQAHDQAAQARTAALLGRVGEALQRWTDVQAEKWDPEGSAGVRNEVQTAEAGVTADYATGKPLAEAAIAKLEDQTGRLTPRIAAVQALKTQVQEALDAADAADASVWVPDLVQGANDAFFQGSGAWKKFHLDAAEEAWTTALFQAKSATALALQALEKKRTEQLMNDTMKRLQDASGKTVVDPQDRIIAPQPWDGKKELEKLQAKPLSLRLPAPGTTAVLGEVQRVTYLDEAKDQWAQGVKAYNAGDLTLANEAFLQAQKLIDTYLAMAVDKVYTVRLIPDHRDSLWRISEYDQIYATPWDWPKIWQRNQKLIQNPDLIYPGWQLIIPPQ